MAHEVRTKIQSRFADFDIFGHANNIAQQSFFDVGKSDYFARTLGDRMLSSDIRVVMVATSTSYIDQIRMHADIEVVTTCEKVGNKSLTLAQRIEVGGRTMSECHATLVVFDFPNQRSLPVPDDWRRRLLG